MHGNNKAVEEFVARRCEEKGKQNKVYANLDKQYEDIYSIEHNGILYINQNYNSQKYGNVFFEISI